jgi:ectoine hydroxylase-related dioxygenase (phytanoyl-CoA dioxygenase family)
LIIPNVLSKDEVQEVLEASVRLHEKNQSENKWTQIGDAVAKDPAIERLMDHPAILPKVRALYGSDRFILQSSWSTRQPARGGGLGFWHQDGSFAYEFRDTAYPVPLLQLRATFLLTDQSEPGLGNLELIPGSHKSRELLPDSVKRDNGTVPISHVICAPIGSVLLFHNGVYHRGVEHKGDFDRHSLHYIYSPPWLRWSDRLQNDQDFLKRTTPLRRYLMGEFERPDAPFGENYAAYDFETDEQKIDDEVKSYTTKF